MHSKVRLEQIFSILAPTYLFSFTNTFITFTPNSSNHYYVLYTVGGFLSRGVYLANVVARDAGGLFSPATNVSVVITYGAAAGSPSVTSVSPSTGLSTGGGNVLSITGNNFAGNGR